MAYERVDELRERDAGMEEKLSFGTYIVKQLRMLGIMFASAGVGALAAFGISRAIGKPRITLNMFKELNPDSTWVGAAAGAVVGGYFTTYEHWAKNEATNLAVSEINHDIAEARLRLDPELKRENLALREMVKQQSETLATRHHTAAPLHAKPEIAAASAQTEGTVKEQQHALSA